MRIRAWILGGTPVVITVLALLIILPWALPGWFAKVRAGQSEELLERTAEIVRKALGLEVVFRVTATEYSSPNQQTRPVAEIRIAKGRIKLGSLKGPELDVYCEEEWEATAEDPVIRRCWGQSASGQWMRESQGDIHISQATSSLNLISARSDGWTYFERENNGSAVDVRTCRAVEGLAALLMGFSNEPFMKWMGCDWDRTGGKGTAKQPWTFTTNPFANNIGRKQGQEGRSKVRWSLSLSTGSTDAIQGIVLEETITDAGSGRLRSRFRTEYTLGFRDKAWPKEEFEDVDRPKRMPGGHGVELRNLMIGTNEEAAEKEKIGNAAQNASDDKGESE